MKSVYKYNNEPEAQKIKSLLESENIPCEIHSFENWGYDGAFRGQIGMGEVIVPDKFSVKAKETIDKFIKEERNRYYIDDELTILKLQRAAKGYRWAKYILVPLCFISVIFGVFLLLVGTLPKVIGILFILFIPFGFLSALNNARKAKEVLDKFKQK